MPSDVSNKAVASTLGGLTGSASFPLTNKSALMAIEGSQFMARNPTPGTGIVGHAAPTTLDDTKPLLLIKNNAAPNSGINLVLDYIRLRLTTAGTASTNVRFDIKVDNINRYTSGGSQLVPQNVNMPSQAQSNALVYYGAITAPAVGGNVRVLDGIEFRPVIGVVGDTYTLNFGGPSHPPTALITSGGAICWATANLHPVVLGPGASLLLHQWSASQSGAITFEPTVSWFER
jgi:hypothetical protein